MTIAGAAGGADAILPPPQPAALSTAKETITAAAQQCARRLFRRIESRFPLLEYTKNRMAANNRSGVVYPGAKGGSCGGFEWGRKAEPPLVVTVTVRGAGLPLEICMVAGI